jgi:hypothetical protein
MLVSYSPHLAAFACYRIARRAGIKKRPRQMEGRGRRNGD